MRRRPNIARVMRLFPISCVASRKGTLGLAMMNIHYEKPVDYDALVHILAERYPRRMLLADPVFDETKN